jgi:purine-binding chemotaxis protein CheW
MVVGLIVDKVAEVLTIEDEDISPPPSYKSGIRNRYIRGIGKIDDEVTLLLDCKKLFDEQETQDISEIE